MPAILPTALVALSLLLLTKIWSNIQWHRKYKLPPGPRGIPFFGNMFQMPPYHQGPWAQQMAQKYGEMFTLHIANTPWVFLNTPRAVSDLLEKRSAIYSSRPRFPYASTLMSGDCRVVLQPYGAQWRATRKIMHSILNAKNGGTFAPFQEVESRQLVLDVLRHPEMWWKANQRFANGVVMSVVFGKRSGVVEKSNVDKLFDTSQEFIAALQPGANLVDTFYFLDRLPKALKWWTRRGEDAFERLLNVYGAEVGDLKERMERGTCPPCFASKFLDDPESEKLGETQRLFALGSLMEAGSDTSRMTLSQIVAAAATDRRWVKEAQAALDRVCGVAARLPEFNDRGQLPYLSAVVKEGFRWRPFAEIGMFHTLINDDIYEDYHFPAGTVFTWNAWHIALNPDEYPDPLRFWPERWLDPSIQSIDPGKVEDPLAGHWSFGAGRRVCTGYHVGDSNVWIAAARLLYCFNFEQVAGKEIDTLNMNVAEHRWAPFDVKITARSEAHRRLLERCGGEAVGVTY
ncbi:cytochrome P450 [Paraphaeosphaeria sporulosa]|uniref:Cytochrome P450 n=1 Tax=Paraphaeosphaeria sporulosa TaxID=1460663 RepID=A0A177BZS6_9PLEO|nr:cytochrome P450 [Paraphaeosphaeria sporulosa]OAF99946.1 cytochrome P450 [Paraphaeosphaeria sporulosa]